MDKTTAAMVDDLAKLSRDPLGHVKWAYPWGEGELLHEKGPRKWQAGTLQAIGDHLNGPSRHEPLLLAVASGHGIGKSALISWVAGWAMETHEDCKVVVTANTEQQLRTKTWPEVVKWRRLSIAGSMFEVFDTAIAAKGSHAKDWRVDRVTWSEHNTDAFAGLHNKRKRIVVIFDEASAIADKVWEVTEGALTDEHTEIIWIAFGNPTRNSGRFRECFRRFRHRWKTWQIDSRTVEGTNKAQIQKWVDDYGEDHDFVKVRVRGQFPAQSAKQFISGDDVQAAFGKHLQAHQYEWAPVIISCDPAWSGDDELVIAKRQGLAFWILKTIPKNDNDMEIAQLLMRLEDEHKADAVFVDGGYGTGIVSGGRTLGRKWHIVWFSGASADPGCLNKRAEMWNSVKRWLKDGGTLPKDQVLADDLTSPEAVPRMDGKIQLESKDDMKARGCPSPNRADALALTFAHPVVKNGPDDALRRLTAGKNARQEYKPFGAKRK